VHWGFAWKYHCHNQCHAYLLCLLLNFVVAVAAFAVVAMEASATVSLPSAVAVAAHTTTATADTVVAAYDIEPFGLLVAYR